MNIDLSILYIFLKHNKIWISSNFNIIIRDGFFNAYNKFYFGNGSSIRTY